MKNTSKEKIKQRIRRKNKVKAKISSGSRQIPRLSVFRSNTHIYVQLIDDSKGKTLASASDLSIKKGENKTDRATKVGEMIAKKAKDLKVDKIIFDRSYFKYHGRVKALAESIRKAGLKF